MRRTIVITIAFITLASTCATAAGVQFRSIVRRGGLPVSSCTSTVTVPLRFAYDPLAGTDQVATTVVTLRCSPPQFLGTIALTAGNSAEFGRRRQMWRNGTDASDTLEYDLYASGNANAVWGDGTDGTTVVVVNRTVATYTALIFARLSYPQRHVSAGNYSDTITMIFDLR
ncbi:MAG: spore coat protein U domain-containing protein [Candidatus Eremiobacteraeota bacterium]|nr:spore coat protein U domain-containing protein [Candidatus Eremiobacteraeota bacterium]